MMCQKARYILTWFSFLIFLSVIALPVGAQERESETQEQEKDENQLRPLKIEQDIDISAELSHPAWDDASSVLIEHMIQPNDQGAALARTEVKVLYSEAHLYIGFIANDPSPDKIRAHISDRDDSFDDDFVGVFLDPFQNNQQAYEFFINPLGIQMDGMRTGNEEDMNFDALWYSEGMLTDSGYQAVMKIPFKSINFPKRDVQDWSVQFIRNYPRTNRYQFAWTNISLSNSCILCQSGTLSNMREVESANTVELIPYAMSYQGSTLNTPGDPASGLDHQAIDGRAGGSISYSPSSTASVDAVVNPDFSQVETDAAQIAANETFALYYDEKRPFFMKGADLFRTTEELYYSRMINRPISAGKFTQKTNDFSLAFLTAYDRDAPIIVPGLYGSSLIQSDINAYNNVFRSKYNLGSESHIGGLLTTRNQQDAHNYVGSVDWNLHLTGQYYFRGQAGYSDTRELDDLAFFDNPRMLGGSGYDAAFNGQRYRGTLLTTEFARQAKFYNFSFSYSSYSPTFQTQNGFINQTDRRLFEGSQSISYYPDSPLISNGSISVSGTWRYDFGGQFQERYIFTGWSNQLPGQTQVSINYLPVNDERFRGRYFTKMNRLMASVNSNPTDYFSIQANWESGRFVNRAADPTMGSGYNASAGVTMQPNARLRLILDYSYSTLSSLDGTETYHSGDIIRLNSQYNFSRRLFARVITQYDSFNSQLQVYPLVYYKLNAFSKFYIGMTDYLNRVEEVNGFNGFRETNRQFFVKFQYLIRS